jgi:uncharacterized membrane protein
LWVRAELLSVTSRASLAIVGFVTATSAWFAGANYFGLVGGILLVAVVPFTLLVVMPINKKLLAPDPDKDSGDARDLLTKWNRLHAVRTLLSLSAFLIFVVIR